VITVEERGSSGGRIMFEESLNLDRTSNMKAAPLVAQDQELTETHRNKLRKASKAVGFFGLLLLRF
jgi:hypothetical protein